MPTEAPEYSTKATAAQTVRSLALREHLDASSFEHDNEPVPSRVPNARVLIVDDDVSVTELFARMLRLEGFEVWAAHSADEGLSLAQTHRPHAVILDLRMPLINGVGFLYRLRQNPANQEIAVGVITGAPVLDDATMTDIRTLCARVWHKPLSVEDIQQVAKILLTEGRSETTEPKSK